MTGPPELRVHGDAIRADAARIEGVTFQTPSAHVGAPCGLSPAKSAADAFNKAAGQEGLLGDQKKLQDRQRDIVTAMRKAADSYDFVDYWASQNIDVGVGPPPGTPQMTADPAGMPSIGSIGDAAGGDFLLPVCFADDAYSNIEATQAAITAPDDCVSLLAAMDEWTTVAASLNDAAGQLPTAPSHWDGTAAPQAYAQVAELRQNLITLATAWMTLAGRANGFAAAHATLKASHAEVYAAYKANEALAKSNPGNNQQYFKAMVQQVAASEEIRRQYAKACELPKGPLPPIRTRSMGSGPGMPGGGSPPSWPAAGSPSGGGGSPAGSGAASSGGGRPGGGTPAQGMGNSAAQKPATPTSPQTGQGAESKQPTAGQPSGGQPPGGSPPGGMPGGMPGGLPSDAGKTGASHSPAVRPASAGGGAGGKAGGGAGKAGGGAGRGGGGMGGKPLSPAVTAEGVAAARGAGPGPGSADAGRAPVGGGAAGGMPMMGHGAGQNQGREKKRSSALSPDENLYTEDRPWTEGVVGHQRREVQGRREAQGDLGSRDDGDST